MKVYGLYDTHVFLNFKIIKNVCYVFDEDYSNYFT